MKHFIGITAVLTLSLSIPALATSPAEVNWHKAEQNYIASLHSDNIGVRNSAAGYVGEYKLRGAKQDLMEILRTDKVEQNRMTAASALMKIGDTDGIDAVKEAVLYDGSAKVSKFCEQLLNKQEDQKNMSLKD